MSFVNIRNLNPYELHKHLINEYILTKPGSTEILKRKAQNCKTDLDVIKENHRFLWDDDSDDTIDTWEKQLAKRYYDKLFKEYCICDLSRYKENKIALRWRVEKEVVLGKGQFICGYKECNEKDELRSWEVNFSYVEEGIKKNALIKLRLCPNCSAKLNYHTKKREIKRIKRKRKTSAVKNVSNNNDKPVDIEINNEIIDDSDTSITTNNDSETCNQPSTSSVTLIENEVTHEQLEKNCWNIGTNVEEKSREEEFNDYLADLLL